MRRTYITAIKSEVSGRALVSDADGSRNGGIAASRPSAPMPFRNADTDLRNSRKLTAGKVGARSDTSQEI